MISVSDYSLARSSSDVGSEPIAEILMRNDVPLTVLQISLDLIPSRCQCLNLENWQLREGIASWTWKFLSALRDSNQGAFFRI